MAVEERTEDLCPGCAKKVFDFETGRTVDRTKMPHPYGTFDVDFRDPKAANSAAHRWTYGSTAKTMKKARRDADAIRRGVGSKTMELRVVDARNGDILAKL